MEVRLNGYTNPTGRCRDCNSMTELTCCDRFRGGTSACTDEERCDSYFFYCLRPFGEVRLNPGCFSNETRNVSVANTDDGPLNFSQSTVLGLNNPQVLSGLEDIYDKVSIDCSIAIVLLPLSVQYTM